jgi:hypothetical protein
MSKFGQDLSYWKHSYKLKDKYLCKTDENSDGMSTLNELFEDVYSCGKSIDLIRICDPQVIFKSSNKIKIKILNPILSIFFAT